MAETYSYDPSKLAEQGLDRMRFDLGDTFTDGGKKTCALCDQEYAAIISIHPDSFNNAKYACVSAIVNKLAFQNDYSAGGMSLSLSQRFKQWQELKKELSKSVSAGVPTGVLAATGNNLTGPHYFDLGMHDILPGEEGV